MTLVETAFLKVDLVAENWNSVLMKRLNSFTFVSDELQALKPHHYIISDYHRQLITPCWSTMVVFSILRHLKDMVNSRLFSMLYNLRT